MFESERKKFDGYEARGLLPALRLRVMSFCAPFCWEVGGHTILANGTMLCVVYPYARYGGRSLHTRSHGEAFLSILQNRIRSGLLLFDEPESALSPQRQLALLAHMSPLVAAGKSQFIIATHSPILLTFPGAQILSFDGDLLRPASLEDTSHFQITKGILQNPSLYWKHLQESGAAQEEPVDTQARKSKSRRTRRSSASGS